MKQRIHKFLGLIYHISIGRLIYHYKLILYRRNLPDRIKRIRQKEKIKVLFVTSGIRQWKSFYLYLAMLNHSRFMPVIGVYFTSKYPNDKKELTEFLTKNNYSYTDLDILDDGFNSINPDIIVYNDPYGVRDRRDLDFDNNLKYVFCGVDYTIHITKLVQHMDHPWYDYCWQFYVEHEDVKKIKNQVLGYRANNILVTGVPRQDELMYPRKNLADPWKDKTGKKRIIYAPHHSIKGTNKGGVEFSTFLDYSGFMLDMACKYQDKISIAFKPHPFLYIKLLDIWGRERTEDYYRRWSNIPNTQFENGEYLGLFQYSDAIIHDSASFIIEYLYMNKPAMYLVAETNEISNMFDYVRDGYNCHEQGTNKQDIEEFIIRVINGVDVKKDQRTSYIKKQLTPPGGKKACDNIIDAILTA